MKTGPVKIRSAVSKVLSVPVALAFLAGPVRGADITWNANSYWQYSGYWSGGVRPTAGDNVFVNNPGLGADNNLVVAPPQSPPDPGWTGTGFYGSMTLNSVHVQRVNLVVYSDLVGYGDTTIQNRAGALVDGGSWLNLGGLNLTGSQSTLTVTNAGSVSSNLGNVGNGVGAASTASMVNSGRWFNDSDLYVGRDGGDGLLNIDSGGTMDLDGSVILGSGGGAGAVQILSTGGRRGILEAYSVIKAASVGTGTLTFDGGILRATRNEANFVAGFTGNDLGITSNGAFLDSNGYDVGISSGFVGQGGLAKQGLGTVTLSGNNSHEGNTVIQRGTLEVTGSGRINSPSATVGVGANPGENGALLLSSGGQVAVAEIAVGSASTGTGSVNVANGTLTVSGSMSVGTDGTGSFALSNGTATNQYAFFGSGAGTGNAAVSGGTWTNSVDLLFGRGSLDITGGTVATTNNSILGAYAGTTTTATASGGTWDTSNFLIVGFASTASLGVSGSGSVIARNGLIVGYDTGGLGDVTISGGTLATTFVAELNAGSGQLNLNGGTLRALANNGDFITGFETGDVNLGGSASIDTNGFNIGISTALGGTGSLTKKGNGTLTLSGNNTYANGTVVQAGTLLVNGDHSADVGTFVDAQATLGGTGILNDVEVGDLGTLPPGTSGGAGLLTIEGDLTMELGATLALDFVGTGAGAFDQIVILDLFTAAGTLSLNVGYAAASGDTFTVFTNGLVGRGWDVGDFTITTNLGNGLSWDTASLASNGMLTVVPEPAAWILLAIGSLLVLGRLRKTEFDEKN